MKYGAIFAMLSIAMGYVAAKNGSWAYLLLYPATSSAIISAGYLFAGASVFGKQADGRRSFVATTLLMPYLLCSYATWHALRLLSREPILNYLEEDLVLSRRLLASELPEDIKSVVDLTCEFTEPRNAWQIDAYLCYPILDGVSPSSEAIRELAKSIIALPKPVLIHCAQGHGRTGLVASAILLVSGKAHSAEHAIEIVKRVRPGIELSRLQKNVLESVQPAVD